MAEYIPRTHGESTRVGLLRPDALLKYEMFRVMHALLFPLVSRRDHESMFANKIGDVVTIKLPYEGNTYTGRTITDDDYAALTDLHVQFRVDKKTGFALRYDALDMALTVENFHQRYVNANAERLAYRFDIDGGNALGLDASLSVGAVGNLFNWDEGTALRQYFTELAIPDDENYLVLSPADLRGVERDLIRGGDANFSQNMPMLLHKILRDKFMGNLSGFKVMTSVHIPYMPVIVSGAPIINGAGQTGASIEIDGLTASVKAFNKGQLIEIVGVGEIQPRTMPIKELGRPKRFTITEDVTADASGEATIKISPPIYDDSITATNNDGHVVPLKAYQNVTDAPADGATVTVVGDNGKTYRQSLAFHSHGLQYANVRVAAPQSADWGGEFTEPNTGMHMTMLREFQFNPPGERLRSDAYYGTGLTRYDLQYRYVSTPVN